MIRVGIYCIDQDRETTSTLGIYNYTRNLIHSIVRLNPSDLEVVLFLSESNKTDFFPADMPPWMSVVVAKGRYGRGLMRLWADHVLAGRMAAIHRVDVMHYPKGWLPVMLSGNAGQVATVHDAIIFSHRNIRDGWRRRLQAHYFCWMTMHTLKHADHVVTVSEYSRKQLSALCPARKEFIHVIYQGAGLSIAHEGAVSLRERTHFMLAGSRMPHKATRETLLLIQQYEDNTGERWPVKVTGLSSWPEEWGESPSRLDIEWLGRISDEALIRLMRHSRLIFYLSHLEGFGLPAIEGYLAWTPVCYRNTTSLAEIMQGIPGGWKGESAEGFISAVQELLTLSENEIGMIQEYLAKKFNWNNTVSELVNVYHALAEERRVGHTADEC